MPYCTVTYLGDVLVFLTGQSEIERACDELFLKAERLDYRYDVGTGPGGSIAFILYYR